MTPGARWKLPDGREALEVEGSTPETLRCCVIVPNWPFPSKPEDIPRAGCKRMPSRYLRETPEFEEARW